MSEVSDNEKDRGSGGLSDVTKRLLSLPGAENYVAPQVSEEEQERGIEKLIEDATTQLDAESMARFLIYSMAWGEVEKDEFFGHPERQPFKSKIKFSEDKEVRKEQYSDILSYFHLKYKKSKEERGENDGITANLKGEFRDFYTVAIDDLFSEGHYEFIDKVCGFEADSRKTGEIKVGQEMLGVIRQAVTEAGGGGELYNQVMEVTDGGYYALMLPYLYNHRGEPKLRRAIAFVLEKRASDKKLVEDKLQLLWQVEKFRMSLGIGLDEFNEINEEPPVAEIKSSIHAFLKNERLSSEMFEEHIRGEASEVYRKHKDSGQPIGFWELLSDRAREKGLADEGDSPEVIADRVKRVKKFIYERNPLGFTESDRSMVFYVTRVGAGMGMGSVLRPVNVEYKNINGDSVRITEVNPRENDLVHLRDLAHESGHFAHVFIIDHAEKAGQAARNSWVKLPGSVKEVFSEFFEKEIAREYRQEGKSSDEPERRNLEWVDLVKAYVARRQGIFGLVQTEARQILQAIWDSGFKAERLTAQQVQEINYDFQSNISKWTQEGVSLSVPFESVWSNINVLDPFDGTRYLRKYRYTDLVSVFDKRFGGDGLTNPDARALPYSIMLTAAENFDTATYATLMREVSVEEAKKKLASIEISEDEI